MEQASITPYTAVSRRHSSNDSALRPSAALASLQSHNVPKRWRKAHSIFATGDSLEEEVAKQIEAEEIVAARRKTTVLDKLETGRNGFQDKYEQEKFDAWAREFTKELETPENPNWNYFCPTNKKKISEVIENLWCQSSPHHRSQLLSLSVKGVVERMHLQSVVKYRQHTLEDDMQKFICRAYFKSKADRSLSDEELESFRGFLDNWVTSLTRHLEGMYNRHYYNYHDNHNWRNISAVMAYLANYDGDNPPPYAHVVEGDHIVSVLQVENLIEQMKLRAPTH